MFDEKFRKADENHNFFFSKILKKFTIEQIFKLDSISCM